MKRDYFQVLDEVCITRKDNHYQKIGRIMSIRVKKNRVNSFVFSVIFPDGTSGTFQEEDLHLSFCKEDVEYKMAEEKFFFPQIGNRVKLKDFDKEGVIIGIKYNEFYPKLSLMTIFFSRKDIVPATFSNIDVVKESGKLEEENKPGVSIFEPGDMVKVATEFSRPYIYLFQYDNKGVLIPFVNKQSYEYSYDDYTPREVSLGSLICILKQKDIELLDGDIAISKKSPLIRNLFRVSWKRKTGYTTLYDLAKGTVIDQWADDYAFVMNHEQYRFFSYNVHKFVFDNDTYSQLDTSHKLKYRIGDRLENEDGNELKVLSLNQKDNTYRCFEFNRKNLDLGSYTQGYLDTCKYKRKTVLNELKIGDIVSTINNKFNEEHLYKMTSYNQEMNYFSVENLKTGKEEEIRSDDIIFIVHKEDYEKFYNKLDDPDENLEVIYKFDLGEEIYFLYENEYKYGKISDREMAFENKRLYQVSCDDTSYFMNTDLIFREKPLFKKDEIAYYNPINKKHREKLSSCPKMKILNVFDSQGRNWYKVEDIGEDSKTKGLVLDIAEYEISKENTFESKPLFKVGDVCRFYDGSKNGYIHSLVKSFNPENCLYILDVFGIDDERRTLCLKEEELSLSDVEFKFKYDDKVFTILEDPKRFYKGRIHEWIHIESTNTTKYLIVDNVGIGKYINEENISFQKEKEEPLFKVGDICRFYHANMDSNVHCAVEKVNHGDNNSYDVEVFRDGESIRTVNVKEEDLYLSKNEFLFEKDEDVLMKRHNNDDLYEGKVSKVIRIDSECRNKYLVKGKDDFLYCIDEKYLFKVEENRDKESSFAFTYQVGQKVQFKAFSNRDFYNEGTIKDIVYYDDDNTDPVFVIDSHSLTYYRASHQITPLFSIGFDLEAEEEDSKNGRKLEFCLTEKVYFKKESDANNMFLGEVISIDSPTKTSPIIYTVKFMGNEYYRTDKDIFKEDETFLFVGDRVRHLSLDVEGYIISQEEVYDDSFCSGKNCVIYDIAIKSDCQVTNVRRDELKLLSKKEDRPYKNDEIIYSLEHDMFFRTEEKGTEDRVSVHGMKEPVYKSNAFLCKYSIFDNTNYFIGDRVRLLDSNNHGTIIKKDWLETEIRKGSFYRKGFVYTIQTPNIITPVKMPYSLGEIHKFSKVFTNYHWTNYYSIEKGDIFGVKFLLSESSILYRVRKVDGEMAHLVSLDNKETGLVNIDTLFYVMSKQEYRDITYKRISAGDFVSFDYGNDENEKIGVVTSVINHADGREFITLFEHNGKVMLEGIRHSDVDFLKKQEKDPNLYSYILGRKSDLHFTVYEFLKNNDHTILVKDINGNERDIDKKDLYPIYSHETVGKKLYKQLTLNMENHSPEKLRIKIINDLALPVNSEKKDIGLYVSFDMFGYKQKGIIILKGDKPDSFKVLFKKNLPGCPGNGRMMIEEIESKDLCSFTYGNSFSEMKSGDHAFLKKEYDFIPGTIVDSSPKKGDYTPYKFQTFYGQKLDILSRDLVDMRYIDTTTYRMEKDLDLISNHVIGGKVSFKRNDGKVWDGWVLGVECDYRNARILYIKDNEFYIDVVLFTEMFFTKFSKESFIEDTATGYRKICVSKINRYTPYLIKKFDSEQILEVEKIFVNGPDGKEWIDINDVFFLPLDERSSFERLNKRFNFQKKKEYFKDLKPSEKSKYFRPGFGDIVILDRDPSLVPYCTVIDDTENNDNKIRVMSVTKKDGKSVVDKFYVPEYEMEIITAKRDFSGLSVGNTVIAYHNPDSDLYTIKEVDKNNGLVFIESENNSGWITKKDVTRIWSGVSENHPYTDKVGIGDLVTLKEKAPSAYTVHSPVIVDYDKDNGKYRIFHIDSDGLFSLNWFSREDFILRVKEDELNLIENELVAYKKDTSFQVYEYKEHSSSQHAYIKPLKFCLKDSNIGIDYEAKKSDIYFLSIASWDKSKILKDLSRYEGSLSLKSRPEQEESV